MTHSLDGTPGKRSMNTGFGEGSWRRGLRKAVSGQLMSLRPAVDIMARTHTTRSPPDRSLAISDDLPSLQWRGGATYVRFPWEILSRVCGSECELGLADAMRRAVSREQGQQKTRRRVHETTLRAITTLGGGHAMSRACPVGPSELKRGRGSRRKLAGMGRRHAA